MLPIIQHIAQEYKAALQTSYGEVLAELILFGSHARGDYHNESDVDFAVILRKPAASASSEMHVTSKYFLYTPYTVLSSIPTFKKVFFGAV